MSPYPDSPNMHLSNTAAEGDAAGTDLVAQLARIAERLEKEQDWRERTGHALFRVKIPGLQVPLTAGAGELADEVWMMPPPDCMMGVRRLTLSGWTAGSVIAYINREDPFMPFPVPASNALGKGNVILESGEHIVISATGITGFVQVNGELDVFPAWYLRYYLGGR